MFRSERGDDDANRTEGDETVGMHDCEFPMPTPLTQSPNRADRRAVGSGNGSSVF